jgi:HlyD family secretion protein
MIKIMTLKPSIFRTLAQPKTLQFMALGALLLLAGVFLTRWWLGPVVQTDLIERREFIQTVVASGHVESPHRIDVGTQLTGTVKYVPVSEGQTVQKDQLLIELESSELLANLKQAELNVIQAEAKIRQLKEVQTPVLTQAYQQALTTQTTTNNALLRAQNLFAQGFIGQATLDEANRSAMLAQSQVISQLAQLASLQPDGSEFWVTQTNLAQALASVELAKARLRNAQVRAPLAGTLISRNVEPGDVVQPGKVLMLLSPQGSTELIVQIDEKHISQLKLGQVAVASADAYNNQQFNAILSFINPGIDLQRGSVTVKLHVPKPPAYLQQDMTVSLNIETSRRADVVLVPSSAVHDIHKTPWVMLVRNQKTVQQKIQVGLRSSGWIEVLSGLAPGDRVIHDPEWTKENARVRLQSIT